MRHIPSNDKFILIVLDILMPILGYWYMKIIKKSTKDMVIKGVINKGIYKYKPVYGDNVLYIAKRYERIGTLTFVISFILSILFVFFLYVNW